MQGPGRFTARVRRPPSVAPSPEVVDHLVRRLLDEVRRERPIDGPIRAPGSRVLLDMRFDGVRVTIRTEPERERPPVALSPREHQVARLVARGYPNKVIAGRLEISSWTVSTHLRRIFAKLGVTTRAAMVASLSQAGLLGPSTPTYGI